MPVALDKERWLTFWTRFNLNRWPSERPANEPQVVVVDGMCDRQAINAYTRDRCGHGAEDCFDRRAHSPILPPAKHAHMPQSELASTQVYRRSVISLRVELSAVGGRRSARGRASRVLVRTGKQAGRARSVESSR